MITHTEPWRDPGNWDAPRAPFVDYSSSPRPQIDEYGIESGVDAFFIGSLASKPGSRKVYWCDGDRYGEAPYSSHGKEDFQAFRAEHGKVILSFGDESFPSLEAVEVKVSKIVATYLAIIDNYEVRHLDFSFNVGLLNDAAGLDRHLAAISQVFAARPALKVSYTLPADGAPGSREGFSPDGVRLLQRLAVAGFQPSLINGLLMRFGETSPPDAYDCCVIALHGMFKQISEVWSHWDADKVWRRIGACPWLGKHANGKVFTLRNMQQLVEFARERQIGCLSGWDASRDDNQGALAERRNRVNNLWTCTGVEQESLDFCKLIATYQPDASSG